MNKIKNREDALLKVKQGPFELKYIDQTILDEEICLEAVKAYGYSLKFVPDSLNTPEICLEAVKSNGVALGEVPPEHITFELVMASMENSKNPVPAMDHISLDCFLKFNEEERKKINDACETVLNEAMTDYTCITNAVRM